MTKLLKNKAKINREGSLSATSKYTAYNWDNGFVFSEDINVHMNGRGKKQREYEQEKQRNGLKKKR